MYSTTSIIQFRLNQTNKLSSHLNPSEAGPCSMMPIHISKQDDPRTCDKATGRGVVLRQTSAKS